MTGGFFSVAHYMGAAMAPAMVTSVMSGLGLTAIGATVLRSTIRKKKHIS